MNTGAGDVVRWHVGGCGCTGNTRCMACWEVPDCRVLPVSDQGNQCAVKTQYAAACFAQVWAGLGDKTPPVQPELVLCGCSSCAADGRGGENGCLPPQERGRSRVQRCTVVHATAQQRLVVHVGCTRPGFPHSTAARDEVRFLGARLSALEPPARTWGVALAEGITLAV